jgi:hypothetical protein
VRHVGQVAETLLKCTERREASGEAQSGYNGWQVAIRLDS